MAYEQANSITFFTGEERLIEAEITPSNSGEVVVIREASWVLTDRATGVVAQSGACEIDGATMTIFFGSEISGFFALEITAKIGRETVKQRCAVSFV